MDREDNRRDDEVNGDRGALQTFTASEFADALKLSRDRLDEFERTEWLPAARRRMRGDVAHRYYTVADLIEARVRLGLGPVIPAPRRQLFLNFKGGVGKTVIATNYACLAARMGVNVLAIDLDAQGHLTKCLGVETGPETPTLLDVLRDGVSLDSVTIRGVAGMPTLSLVPATLALSTIEIILSQKNAREFRLKKALDGSAGGYDLVVLDAPPNLSLLNLNAILAIDDLIIPVLTDFLSYDGLRILFENLGTIKEDFDFEPERIGILINGYNASEALSRQSREAIEGNYGDLVLRSVIRKNTAIGHSTAEQRSIFEVAPRSRAAQDIQGLLTELLGL